MAANARWLQEVGDERERLRAEFARKDDETARLDAEKDEILSRIRLLDALLGAYGLQPSPPQHQTRPEEQDLAGVGLRDAIRAVLAQRKKRLKPAVVVRIMQENGYTEEPGKTNLHVRVSNELWRMAKQKRISRTAAGYTLKTTNPPGVGAPEGS